MIPEAICQGQREVLQLPTSDRFPTRRIDISRRGCRIDVCIPEEVGVNRLVDSGDIWVRGPVNSLWLHGGRLLEGLGRAV